MHVDLRGRKPYARRGVHGFEQIGDELAQPGIEQAHRRGPDAQPGIGEFEYGQSGHQCTPVLNPGEM